MESGSNRSVLRTKARIRDALIALMRDKPVRRITVSELIEKADVSRSTFYAYYRDVYDLKDSIEDAFLREIRAQYDALAQIPRTEEEHPITTAVFEIFRRYSGQLAVLLGPNGDMEFLEKFRSVARAILDELWRGRYGDQIPDHLRALGTSAIANAGIGMYLYQIHCGMDYPPELTGHILGELSVFMSKTLSQM